MRSSDDKSMSDMKETHTRRREKKREKERKRERWEGRVRGREREEAAAEKHNALLSLHSPEKPWPNELRVKKVL